MSFFDADSDAANARGQIDLATVGSVRVSKRKSRLPGGGKGIELHTPNRVWLLCPATEEEFIEWLQIISVIVTSNVARLLIHTGDDELTKEISNINVKKLQPNAKTMLQSGKAFQATRTPTITKHLGPGGRNFNKTMQRTFSSSANMMRPDRLDLDGRNALNNGMNKGLSSEKISKDDDATLNPGAVDERSSGKKHGTFAPTHIDETEFISEALEDPDIDEKEEQSSRLSVLSRPGAVDGAEATGIKSTSGSCFT